ncbi:MAG: MBL fold metallo-hydrolase [Candidatus Latescibacteria bacterium]|jgi:hydroxyacylglutathione hydrolase|nr:MBL fold metallo-hydrolase [Candidatus Latescibacterota bacterium]
MRITSSIYLVGGTTYGLTNGNDSHIYLIKGPSGIFLIDAGNGYDTEGLLRNIRDEGFDPLDINHILITHHHTDHARGAKALKDALGCEVWISDNTGKHLLEEGTDEELGVNYAKEHGMYSRDYVYIHCPVDHGIKDGESFTIAGIEITTINVIGHSDDSTCFLMHLDGRKCLFSGDIVYAGGIIGLLNYPMSSLEGYHEGLPKLKNLDIDALFPGHRMFTLSSGQGVIDAGLKHLDGIFVPPSVGQRIENI